jgi:hypothetical protein
MIASGILMVKKKELEHKAKAVLAQNNMSTYT